MGIMPSMKTISYRGGVVIFRIPDEWQEEYDETRGGTFYAPGENTGTLRLNVLTMDAPTNTMVTASTAKEVLEGESRQYEAPVLSLGDGVAMIRYDLPAKEGGQALTIRYWRVAQSLPPTNVRLALFSYTLLADQWDDTSTQGELALLDREITAVQFASELGQLPAPRKPWWRFW